MRAIARPWLIRKGYDGMTFFGCIITHSKEEAARINAAHTSKSTDSSIIKNHEMIHLYQARSTHDSWLCFYILYGWYWLLACRYWRRLKNAGYRLNPFEMEAYAHMHDLHYLDDKQSGTTEWRRYAQMSLRERLNACQMNVVHL